MTNHKHIIKTYNNTQHNEIHLIRGKTIGYTTEYIKYSTSNFLISWINLFQKVDNLQKILKSFFIKNTSNLFLFCNNLYLKRRIWTTVWPSGTINKTRMIFKRTQSLVQINALLRWTKLIFNNTLVKKSRSFGGAWAN